MFDKNHNLDFEVDNEINKGLDSNLDKIEPVVKNIMKKFIGISVEELNTEISEKLSLKETDIISINYSEKYKDAKKIFLAKYVESVLVKCYGNVSVTAEWLNVERRTVHRIIKNSGIDVKRVRNELLRPSYLKEIEIAKFISDSIDNFKEIIHPSRIENIYNHVDDLSREIANGVSSLSILQGSRMLLKECEEEFDRRYLMYYRDLIKTEKYMNLKYVSKKIGLAYETLIRKMKKIS